MEPIIAAMNIGTTQVDFHDPNAATRSSQRTEHYGDYARRRGEWHLLSHNQVAERQLGRR